MSTYCRAAVAAFYVLAAAHAAAFPSKPIRVVVPCGAGGPSDFVARTYAERLRVALNVPVIVDSRPGGNTAIGTDITAKANPDGHTLLVVSMMTAVSLPYLQKTLPYKLDDLMLLNRFATTPMVLSMHPSVPATTLKELVAYAKSNPGKLNYGSSGVGQAYHLAAALFSMRTGVEMNHIPYKGSAQTFTDLLGGNIQLAFDAPLAPLPHLSSGKLRVLGTTGSKRLPQLPNVPTFMEQGIPQYDLELRWGVIGPKGIPRDVAAQLHAETARIAALADVKEALFKLAIETATCASVQTCATEFRAESELVGGIIRNIGIKPE